MGETVPLLDSLWVQERHAAKVALTNWLKENKAEWGRVYITQCVHEVMFTVLTACYDAAGRYRDEEVFAPAAKALGMDRIDAMNHGHHRDDDEKGDHFGARQRAGWIAESGDIIRKKLGSHFTSHYAVMLDQEKVSKNVMAMIKKKVGYLRDWKEDGHEMGKLMEYIKKCCDICWIMVIQSPPLTLHPMEWRGRGETFDESQHQAVGGRKSKGRKAEAERVQYYIWPRITYPDGQPASNEDDVVPRQKVSVQEVLRKPSPAGVPITQDFLGGVDSN